jgi:transposase
MEKHNVVAVDIAKAVFQVAISEEPGARAPRFTVVMEGASRPIAHLALALEKRTLHNKAAVALANKLARIAWAVWKHGKEHEPTSHAA